MFKLTVSSLSTPPPRLRLSPSIYKADGKLLQQSSAPPMNLSLQIGDTVPEMFGKGTTMTVSDVDVFCPNANEQKYAPKSS